MQKASWSGARSGCVLFPTDDLGNTFLRELPPNPIPHYSSGAQPPIILDSCICLSIA